MSNDIPNPAVEERASSTSDLRKRILAAATRFFAERGYGATSMRELAEVARCTKPALYYYFRNKEALFHAVIETNSRPLTSLLEQTIKGDGTVMDRILRGINAYLDQVQRNPNGLGVLIRAELRAEPEQPVFDVRSARTQTAALIRALLEEGVAGGEIQADVNLDDAVLSLIALLEYKCWLWLLDKKPIEPNFAERAVRLFFHGVAR